MSASSVEDSVEKKSRYEEETPSWALKMIADIEHTKNNTNKLVLDMNEMKAELRSVKNDVTQLNSRVEQCEISQNAATARILVLEERCKDQESKMAEQIDRSMRNSITIHNLPISKPRETWAETAAEVAKFLMQHLPGDWSERVERAHRGKTNGDIHCRFESWRYADAVLELFRSNKYRINNIFVLEKFSMHTQARRDQASKVRKHFKEQNPGSKSFIRYPATVMGKKHEATRYTIINEF